MELDRLPSRRFYLPELDALRFFGFLCVFTFHAAQHLPANAHAVLRAFTDAGRYGVDLFFLLSAYLITRLLMRERAVRGILDVPRFYVRRILRIWPLYFFFVAFAYGAGLALHQPLSWHYLVGFIFLSGNWVCAVQGLPDSVIFPLWSVSVEEQFYLLWPLALRRGSNRLVVGIALALLVLGNATRVVVGVMHITGVDLEYVTFARGDSIACGILIAMWLPDGLAREAGRCRLVLFLLGIGLWSATAYATSGRGALVQWAVGYPWIVLGCVAIFLATLGCTARIVQNRALLELGRMSYGLYVFHVGAITAASILLYDRRSWTNFAGFLITGMVLTIAFATASYNTFEQHFLRLKERFTDEAPANPLVSSLRLPDPR